MTPFGCATDSGVWVVCCALRLTPERCVAPAFPGVCSHGAVVQDPDGWAVSGMDYWWLGQQSCGWVTLSIPWGVLPQHTIGIAVGTVGV